MTGSERQAFYDSQSAIIAAAVEERRTEEPAFGGPRTPAEVAYGMYDGSCEIVFNFNYWNYSQQKPGSWSDGYVLPSRRGLSSNDEEEESDDAFLQRRREERMAREALDAQEEDEQEEEEEEHKEHELTPTTLAPAPSSTDNNPSDHTPVAVTDTSDGVPQPSPIAASSDSTPMEIDATVTPSTTKPAPRANKSTSQSRQRSTPNKSDLNTKKKTDSRRPQPSPRRSSSKASSRLSSPAGRSRHGVSAAAVTATSSAGVRSNRKKRSVADFTDTESSAGHESSEADSEGQQTTITKRPRRARYNNQQDTINHTHDDAEAFLSSLFVFFPLCLCYLVLMVRVSLLCRIFLRTIRRPYSSHSPTQQQTTTTTSNQHQHPQQPRRAGYRRSLMA